MKRHLPYVLLSALVALLSLSLSCSNHDAEAGADSRVILVLFDLSDSTSKVREKYLKEFDKILQKIRPGDLLIVDKVTQNPLTTADFPVKMEFRKFNPWRDNELAYKKEMIRKKAEAKRIVEEMLSGSGGSVGRSKILDALLVAEGVFKSYSAGTKILVLACDMIEEGDFLDFTKESLTEARIEEIINQESSAGRLPELGGVRVYVTGFGGGIYQGLSTKKMLAVREFWLKLFRRSGADLPEQRFGSALLEFE